MPILQKGYKRRSKGMAVLRCCIGLFIMVVVIMVVYFAIRVDYSDKIDPETTVRAYVEETPTADPTELATTVPTEAAADDDADTSETDADTSGEDTSVAIVSAASTDGGDDVVAATEEATAEPTATPTPEPTATPEPTSIPESEISALNFNGPTIPPASSVNAELGITYSYRSVADSYRLLVIQGYAYINDPEYDGSTAEIYLVINQSTGASALALPTKISGISGVDHSDALCANPEDSDFEVVIDVADFANEIYTLGMIFVYTDSSGTSHTEYVEFPGDTSFTVLNQQVVADLRVDTTE